MAGVTPVLFEWPHWPRQVINRLISIDRHLQASSLFAIRPVEKPVSQRFVSNRVVILDELPLGHLGYGTSLMKGRSDLDSLAPANLIVRDLALLHFAR